MDKQELLEKASAKFKKDFGVSHIELGFNFIKFHKNKVLFAKSIEDFENLKKSDSIAIKAIIFNSIITLISILLICISLANISNSSNIQAYWLYTLGLLYVFAFVGHNVMFYKCKYFENLCKNNIFTYKLS